MENVTDKKANKEDEPKVTKKGRKRKHKKKK